MAAKKPNKKPDKFALKAVVATLPGGGAIPVPAHQVLAANGQWFK